MNVRRPERPKKRKAPLLQQGPPGVSVSDIEHGKLPFRTQGDSHFLSQSALRTALGNHQAGADPVSNFVLGVGSVEPRSVEMGDGRTGGRVKRPILVGEGGQISNDGGAKVGSVGRGGLANDRRWVHQSNPSPDRHSERMALSETCCDSSTQNWRVFNANLQNLVRWLQYARRSSFFRQLRYAVLRTRYPPGVGYSPVKYQSPVWPGIASRSPWMS